MGNMRINGFRILSAEEAAFDIQQGDLVGFSGFAVAASPKLVPTAIAQRAAGRQRAGDAWKIRVLTGAHGGPTLDDVLAESDAVSWWCPYQNAKLTRDRINQRGIQYIDMHLSQVAQSLAGGMFGRLNCTVVEATEITPDGRVYLSTSIGIVPALLQHAEKVIIELNERQPSRLREMMDIYSVPAVPFRKPLNICSPLDRIGTDHARVDPAKVAGVVMTNQPDEIGDFLAIDDSSRKIASHVVEFLMAEIHRGALPRELPPIQAGIGNLCNAVMAGFDASPEFPAFSMYTATIQDSFIDLLEKGRVTGISGASLSTSRAVQQNIFDNMDFFGKRIVLRPSEISNSPEVVRRLGVIALNPAIEFDLYGNVNSTHINGTTVMNGIGGGADYASNSPLAIFITPSNRKSGKISSVVPMCPHVDHNEHAVHVVITEQGVADLRGLDPRQRAMRIIDNCAHPSYRDYLREYVESCHTGRIPHDLRRSFELYVNLMENGSMLPAGKERETTRQRSAYS
jgi:acetyl-CoA hydrolase